MVTIKSEIKPHELETIRILTGFDELVDVPILHPFRCHCEEGEGIIHHYPQKWQHIRMVKYLPSYNLLAEPLEWEKSAVWCARRQGTETHASYLLEVACRVNPQDFDRNMTASMLALPYVSVPAVVQRSTRSVVAKWDFQRFRKQSVAAANLAQGAQTLPPEPRREISAIQDLVNGW